MPREKAGQIPRQPMPVRPPAERRQCFDEVALGFDEQLAKAEAERCIQCKKPRCVQGCPVQVRIPEFIKALRDGDMWLAVEVLKDTNSLPAVCGRVCPQETQCEIECVLGKRGEPVAIGRLERYVADWERREGMRVPEVAPPTGRRVVIIGAGPAGLTAAGDLAKLGHHVDILEALHVPGGVLMYGIPEFRLPKETVLAEIQYLESLGVAIHTNAVVGKLYTLAELLKQYDAMFLGTGAGLPMMMNIPGENYNGVYSANEMHHAEEEGIIFDFLTAPVAIHGTEDGWVRGMRCIRMELGEPDASGRRRPVPVEGSEFDMEVDTVVMALGTQPNPLVFSEAPELERTRWGTVVCDQKTGRTKMERVWAGGDIVTGAATVISAMGAGRIAANDMHAYISNGGDDPWWPEAKES